MKLAIVSGTSIARLEETRSWPEIEVDTPYGKATLKQSRGLVLANRHGFGEAMPPHAINYRAYVAALIELGVDTVLTISSVGSLREGLAPGSFVSCSDYVSFAPKTFFDDRMSGFAPQIDNRLLDELKSIVGQKICPDGVYAQTPGPRFETRAEVRILRQWGCDVVGMTFANEADLILESGLSLTSLCMVDNFAHGHVSQQLTMESFKASVAENQAKVNAAFRAAVDHWGEPG